MPPPGPQTITKGPCPMSSEHQGRPTPLDETPATVVVPPVVDPRLGDKATLPPHPQTTQQQRRFAFGILLLSIVCLGLGQTILFAILPPMARAIGIADGWVGVIFTFSALMWVLTSPFWGQRSDVWGRKPVILLGVGMFAASITGLGIVMQLGADGILGVPLTIFLLFVLRSLHGGFASASPAASQAYVADRTAPEERTSSLAGFAAAFGLGATLGPGIGSATAQYGPLVSLLIVGGIGVVVFGLIWRYLPERSRPMIKENTPKLRFTDPRLRTALLYGTGGGVLMVVPIQIIGFYLIDTLALPEVAASQLLGVAFMVHSLATLFSQLVIIQRFEIPRIILLQLAPPMIMVGHLIIAMGQNFGTIAFGLMITGLGVGLFMPAYTASVSLSVRPDEQGAAAGLANSASAIGFIIAPVMAFTLYTLSPQTPFWVTTGIAGLLSLYARYRLRPKILAEQVASAQQG